MGTPILFGSPDRCRASELFLRPLLDSYRGLVGFLDTGSQQVRGLWLPFDTHLGVVSLDGYADGG